MTDTNDCGREFEKYWGKVPTWTSFCHCAWRAWQACWNLYHPKDTETEGHGRREIMQADFEDKVLCRKNMARIFEAVKSERQYQDNKWGTIEDHPHDVPGWLLIMQSELHEAIEAWVHEGGDIPALREILQVIATGCACLEQHGVYEREKAGHGKKRPAKDFFPGMDMKKVRAAGKAMRDPLTER